MNEKLKFGMNAGEARELGIEVPEHVPDVAVAVPVPAAMTDSSIDIKDGEDGQVIISMRIPGRWQWTQGTVVL